jgi:hypothetical protein
LRKSVAIILDALLETASKGIIRHGLRLKILNRVITNDVLGDFVESLPLNGRTSILKLLEAAGCPPEEQGFIEATRKVRNAYAVRFLFFAYHIAVKRDAPSGA